MALVQRKPFKTHIPCFVFSDSDSRYFENGQNFFIACQLNSRLVRLAYHNFPSGYIWENNSYNNVDSGSAATAGCRQGSGLLAPITAQGNKKFIRLKVKVGPINFFILIVLIFGHQSLACIGLLLVV